MSLYEKLSPFHPETNYLNTVIDTPKGSRNKYSYQEKTGLFELSGVLPAGAVFPFDFGFIPQTLGGDGDPLDVLVLMDEPAFVGCVVPARLLGVIEANQTEKGNTVRNDRLIAVAVDSPAHDHLRSLDDLAEQRLHDIEHFFISYNDAKRKKFEPLGRFGPDRARSLIDKSQRGK
ncbi:MAG TPA: inorganic diphosphatase [Chthoniobacterales bacterium]|nr:inorganic diphosphatase [Chthoniobacterales bacterium]